MPLYVSEITSTGSPQAMLPRFDENSFVPVSLSDMLTAVANAVSLVSTGGNFRINQATGFLQLRNATTGLYNTINSSGADGGQIITFQNGAV